MPNLRDRSKIASPNIFEVNDDKTTNKKKPKCKWSFEDKKRMLIFIKRYGVDQILSNPVFFFHDKTFKEIDEFIKDIKRKKFPNYYADHYLTVKTKKPIELWQENLRNLSANIKDHTNIIAMAVDKINLIEKLDESQSAEDPNWRLIYKYLSAALSHHPLPNLHGIDASVILKLIGELIGYVDGLEVECQRKLLLQKLELLAASNEQQDDINKLTTRNKALLLGNSNEDRWELTTVDKLLEVQKEPLYFLNPLNIPVKLLRPKNIHT